MNDLNQKVTAVLPARNCRRELAVCISALLAGDCPPAIIVVDDGSDDGTARMVHRRWPSAVLLRIPAHTGFAHAANAGLRLVRTQYAFLIRPELQPGRSCARRLLEAMETPGAEDVFCAVPEPWKRPEGAGRSRRAQPASILAVPDGCAMYRMEALEETGWLDERHFDGLEAFDLALRAALAGARTVQVPGARVRPADGPESGCAAGGRESRGKSTLESTLAAGGAGRNAYGLAVNTFRRQMAAGNAGFVFYKNLPLFQRILNLPALTAVERAQAAAFARRGGTDEYRMARERGKALCALEKERRQALADGVSVWPETLADAAFLGMEEPADRMYPLYLAHKEPLSLHSLPACARLQLLLLRELPAIRALVLN